MQLHDFKPPYDELKKDSDKKQDIDILESNIEMSDMKKKKDLSAKSARIPLKKNFDSVKSFSSSLEIGTPIS